MRWIRTKIRIGSGLALFALAIQLLLSFGHIHLAAASNPSSSIAVATSTAGSPAGHQNGTVDINCPVCALIHLASVSSPPTAPVLPVPTMFGFARLEAADAFNVAASSRGIFRARAPPCA
jgi:hypothetical protein